jgi:hypothetical protein
LSINEGREQSLEEAEEEQQQEQQEQQQTEQEEEDEEIDTSSIFNSTIIDVKRLKKIVGEGKGNLYDLLKFYWLELPAKLTSIDSRLSLIQQQLQKQGVFPESTMFELMEQLEADDVFSKDSMILDVIKNVRERQNTKT